MCLPPSSCDMVSSFRKPSGQEDGRSQGKREMGPELAVRLLPEAWKGEEGGNHTGHCCPPGRDVRAHFLTELRLPRSLGCQLSSHPHPAHGGPGGSSLSVVLRSETSPVESRHYPMALGSRGPGRQATLGRGCRLAGTGHRLKPRRPVEGAPA